MQVFFGYLRVIEGLSNGKWWTDLWDVEIFLVKNDSLVINSAKGQVCFWILELSSGGIVKQNLKSQKKLRVSTQCEQSFSTVLINRVQIIFPFKHS